MAVIGHDDRIVVPHERLDDIPFSAITQITSVFPNGNAYTGSGALVGPNDLLTAAHVVYSEEDGGWASEVYTTPGLSPNDQPFGVTQGTNIQSVSGWIEYADFAWDYALVTLQDSVGNQTGWFDIVSFSGNIIGAWVDSAGYPGDFNSETMAYTSGTVDDIGNNAFIFRDDFDSFPGQSGSPVFFTDENGNSSIVGLVSWEQYWPVNQNGVLAFDDGMVSQLDAWISENGGGTASNAHLFDSQFYLDTYTDVADAVATGAMPSASFHYDHWGWREGRDPNSSFDTSFYLESNLDVAASGMNPLNHYASFGRWEGRPGAPTNSGSTDKLITTPLGLGSAPTAYARTVEGTGNWGWLDDRHQGTIQDEFFAIAYGNDTMSRGGGSDVLAHFLELWHRAGASSADLFYSDRDTVLSVLDGSPTMTLLGLGLEDWGQGRDAHDGVIA
jgi:V8-like Glu-specific endopeptidase